MHACFLAPNMGLGGAENHLIQYANALITHGHSVTVISLGSDTELASRLNHQISFISLNRRIRQPSLWVSAVQCIRKRNPDVVIGWAFWGASIACLTKTFHNRRVVVVELNYPPAQQRYSSTFLRILVFKFIKHVYKVANVVTANSDETTSWLKTYIGSGPRYQRVYNPIDFENCQRLAQIRSEILSHEWKGTKLLAIGRIVLSHKGFDLLVRSLKRIETLDWTLFIAGSGPDESPLKSLIKDLRLTDRIILVGAHRNPFPLYAEADIVICPSRFEGFPNVLLEALSLSKATIATDCLSGPRELTEAGSIAVLVPPDDENSLADAISSLITNIDKRQHYASISGPSIRRRYSKERVYEALEKALEP